MLKHSSVTLHAGWITSRFIRIRELPTITVLLRFRDPLHMSTLETAFDGKDDGLGARPDAELVEKIGDVIANCLFADG